MCKYKQYRRTTRLGKAVLLDQERQELFGE